MSSLCPTHSWPKPRFTLPHTLVQKHTRYLNWQKNFKKSATSASYVSAIQNTHAHASILHKIFYVKVNHVKRHLVLPTLKYCLHSIGVNGATFAVLCWKLAPHSCVVLGAPLFEISWSTLHTCEINWRDGIVNTAHYKVLDLLWF